MNLQLQLTIPLRNALDSNDLTEITTALRNFIKRNNIDLDCPIEQIKVTQLGRLNDKMTAAIIDSNTKQIKELLEKGADLEERYNDSNTCLMRAARINNVAVLKTLLENGATLDNQNSFGYSALMWAVISGAYEAANFLIKAGANINMTDEEGNSALLMAIYFRRENLTELLLEAGADYKKENNHGYCALSAIAKFNYKELKTLINNFISKNNKKENDL